MELTNYIAYVIVAKWVLPSLAWALALLPLTMRILKLNKEYALATALVVALLGFASGVFAKICFWTQPTPPQDAYTSMAGYLTILFALVFAVLTAWTMSQVRNEQRHSDKLLGLK